MKVPPRAIDGFLRAPDPAARAVLLYGPDAGLVAERAEIICKTAVADLADPFVVAALTGAVLADDPARLADEAAAIPMVGGARLVRVAGAGSETAVALGPYLEAPPAHALVVVEAGGLGPSAPLRKLCEKAGNAAALACYVEEGRDLTRTIAGLLEERGARADRAALEWLSGAIGGDRARVRGEVAKLALHHGGESGPIGLAEAQAVCGGGGAAALDALTYALTARDGAGALEAHGRLVAEGVAGILILRAVQAHFRRLHAARARADAGEALDGVAKSLRVFFKQAPAFRAAVRAWPLPRTTIALQRLADLEARCKRTGTPETLLTAQAFLSLAR